MATKDCVVFLTHRWSPPIAGHYERLRREIGGMVDVRLAYQAPSAEAPVPLEYYPVVVTTQEVIDAFPLRVATHGDKWMFDCCELFWLAACMKPELATYDCFWVIEYDVDFSGDWVDFFSEALGYEGDLLGIDVKPLRDEPDWWNIASFSMPAHIASEPILGFFPLLRATRSLLDHYRSRISAPGWSGHFEVVLPSLAAAGGYTVREIGGDSPFTPPERRGRHYTTRRMAGRSATFDFRPLRGTAYYEQEPGAFAVPGMLYHPVKADLPDTEVRRFHRTRRWILFRDWFLRRRAG